MRKIADIVEEMGQTVTSGYKKMQDGVVSGYKKSSPAQSPVLKK